MTTPHSHNGVPPVESVESLLTVFDGMVTEPPRTRDFAPLLLLLPGEVGDAGADGHADATDRELPARVVEGLRARCVDSEGRPLAPVALWPPPETAQRGGAAGRGRARPEDNEQVRFYQELVDGLATTKPADIGRLRFRDFTLMRTVVETRLTQLSADAKAVALREAVHRARFPGRPGAPPTEELRAVLPWFGHVLLWGWSLVAQPLTSRRVNRMMTRGWFAHWSRSALGAVQRGFFRPAAQLTQGGTLHTAEHIDAVLTRALLADVERAFRRRWLSPWRRRRTTRWVLLLNEPAEPDASGPHGAGENRVRGFLSAYVAAVAQQRTTGTLVVAGVGQETAAEFRMPRVGLPALGETLTAASGDLLRGYVVPLPHSAEPSSTAERWLREHPKLPDRAGPYRSPAGAAVLQWTALGACGVLLVTGAGYAGVPLPLIGPSSCPEEDQFTVDDGASCLGLNDGPDRFKGSARAYTSLMKQISNTNKEVDALDDAHEKRTVVVFQPFTAAGDTLKDLMADGVLPELQGIALMQEEMLREAEGNTNNVALRLMLANAGPRFEQGKRVADLVVKRQDEEKIVGAVGFGQSLKATRQTIEVLMEENIPVIGTSATADNLVGKDHPYYHLAPTNQRAAEAAVSFLKHEEFVEPSEGKMAKAEALVVVYDGKDLYSENLAQDVEAEFKAKIDKPVEMVDEKDSHLLTRKVCRQTRKEPATVVFWARRAADMFSFLREHRGLDDCGKEISVIGGDDLTNALIEDENPLDEHGGLTLHHLAHAMPSIYTPTHEAKRHVAAYKKKYAKYAKYAKGAGDGAYFANDGHPALGWDALKVIAYATNRARDNRSHGRDVDHGSVATALDNGRTKLAGATGVLVFQGPNDRVQVPPNKPIFVIHDTHEGPKTVLACGNFGVNAEKRTWGSGTDPHPCPVD